jgi:hypothetical protein
MRKTSIFLYTKSLFEEETHFMNVVFAVPINKYSCSNMYLHFRYYPLRSLHHHNIQYTPCTHKRNFTYTFNHVHAIEELRDQYTTSVHLRKSPKISLWPCCARNQLERKGRWSENETFIVTVVLQGFAVHTLVY